MGGGGGGGAGAGALIGGLKVITERGHNPNLQPFNSCESSLIVKKVKNTTHC